MIRMVEVVRKGQFLGRFWNLQHWLMDFLTRCGNEQESRRKEERYESTDRKEKRFKAWVLQHLNIQNLGCWIGTSKEDLSLSNNVTCFSCLFIFLNTYHYVTWQYILFVYLALCLSIPLECKLCEDGNLKIFIHYSVPRIVPNIWELLNKYLLNE